MSVGLIQKMRATLLPATAWRQIDDGLIHLYVTRSERGIDPLPCSPNATLARCGESARSG
jgi:hypothetical protein